MREEVAKRLESVAKRCTCHEGAELISDDVAEASKDDHNLSTSTVEAYIDIETLPLDHAEEPTSVSTKSPSPAALTMETTTSSSNVQPYEETYSSIRKGPLAHIDGVEEARRLDIRPPTEAQTNSEYRNLPEVQPVNLMPDRGGYYFRLFALLLLVQLLIEIGRVKLRL